MEKAMSGNSCQKWASFVKGIWRDDRPEEQLYSVYTRWQKQRAVPWLLTAGVLFDLFVFLVPGNSHPDVPYTIAAAAIFLNIMLGVINHLFFPFSRYVIPYLVWMTLWYQLLYIGLCRMGDAYNELLGWAVVFQYLTLATVPYNILQQVICSILSVLSYFLLQYYNATYNGRQLPDDFVDQQLANGALLLVATILGIAAFSVWDGLQRTAFQDTKKSLVDKLVIEQQSKEQERLLLSVLPEHVAIQMRDNLGLIDTQFKKIYMSRHENVSILYADIVGFTAISSTYSAQDLVAILNELFARFDRLAEKYNQLRIKILGDCYYCISGAPVERPDHAVLCVHMGLSMVKAIKYVQQTTNSPVDMRVGIHTGAVLAGVLGQRQWQFDVYSRDVELANKMESSGMAGRVHISEMTLSYLNDEFEVEPAHGERREEMLRQAGIKTYFISKVLKPYQGHESGTKGEGEATDEGDLADTPSDLKDDDEDSVLSPQEENNINEDMRIYSMLEKELLDRDDKDELADATTFCLSFKNSEMEKEYIRRPDPCPLFVAILPVLLVPAFLIIANFAVPSTLSLHVIYVALVVETGIFNITYYVCVKCLTVKEKNIDPFWKMICGIFNISMFVVANILPLIICGSFETALDDGLRPDSLTHSGARRCHHPSYYYHVGATLACGVLWVPLGLVSRAATLLGLAAAHTIPAIMHHALLRSRPNLDYNPYEYKEEDGNSTTMLFGFQINSYTNILLTLHEIRHILMLFFIAVTLIIYNRYSESLERARHSRGMRMRVQAEQAADMRRRNQALVHNVLPPHVARHFMGGKHHHRDLYSQSYAEVGVLFASMPNFTEFYSEESVNNQGLECLRFLNEVISDFDMLLEDPKFCKDIIKIKTISSTYMAASGLNPTRQMQPSDGVVVRWAHLACLVEFALELQRTLTAINEQSFNHFVLRLGINHGPITAGVIGARKPHYDIWGNTVNVASRMESTGKAGCIQVTEETCEILQMFGYYFEQRGLVAVKGKGQLMTYYLQGKRTPPTSPTAAHCVGEIAQHEGDSLIANGEATKCEQHSVVPNSSDDPNSSLLKQD